jgi:hypothetical protein
MNIQLPEGFGLPVKAGTKLDYFTMALNQNPGEPERVVRMKTEVKYRRPVADEPKPTALFLRALSVYQQHLPDDSAGDEIFQASHQGEQCGEACLNDARGKTKSTFISLVPPSEKQHPGHSCCVLNASADGVVPQFGKNNTIHWMVPPGRHRYRSEVTKQLDLPRDTAAHYITGHLHPYGEWMRLVDMDTGEVVLEITAEHFTDKLGVKHMSEITSREGIALRKDHRYELITEYNNTLDRPLDAMAILYLYIAE